MPRNQLGTHGVIHADTDVNQHVARNLTPNYSVQDRSLPPKEDLSRKILEDVVLNAYGEMEWPRRRG